MKPLFQQSLQNSTQAELELSIIKVLHSRKSRPDKLWAALFLIYLLNKEAIFPFAGFFSTNTTPHALGPI